LDKTGEFSGSCKVIFDTSAQAEQSVLKIKTLNFVGLDLKARMASKAVKIDPNSNIKVNNIDSRIN
jgi:hypothetical protein